MSTWMRMSVMLASGMGCAAALAQTAPQHVERLEAVTVTGDAGGQGAQLTGAPTEVLSGDELILKRQGTLGDTLNGMLGVHADTFGAGASRPVVRGQTSPRVMSLSDGSEVMDASAISPDHAVDIEPMLTQSLEVLRGPATLLYGGGAIGGVVNAIDNRIPTRAPDGGFEASLDARGGTGNALREGAFSMTAGQDNFAIHIEGLKRRAGDYRVPGWSSAHLAGTREDTARGSVGASWLGSWGYFGVAYTRTDRKYGLPGHEHGYEQCQALGNVLDCPDLSGEDHEAEAPPWIKARSDRVDVRGELRQPFAGVQSVRLRGGWTDYRHDEIEEGAVGSTFKNRGYDLRIEADHNGIAGSHGIAGVQMARSDLGSAGEEAFLPMTRSDTAGVFLLEHFHLNDRWRFELGARYDWKKLRPEGGQPHASFDAASVSGAAIWTLAPQYALSLSLSHSHRLPNAQELYANGVHLASNTLERGNPNLGKETSSNIDLTLRKHAGSLQFSLGVFHNQVKNYIYAQTTDQVEGFRLIDYRQQDARFNGVEGRVDYAFSPSLSAGVFGDAVRGKLTGGAGNLPRIPSARAGVRGQYKWGRWAGQAELYRVLRQERVASFEQKTPGYTMMNMSLSYSGSLGAADYMVYLRVSNLFNQLALNHASYLAHVAPLPGRAVTLGLRLDY
jgi:iron complex outermembrane receptor protein